MANAPALRASARGAATRVRTHRCATLLKRYETSCSHMRCDVTRARAKHKRVRRARRVLARA
eukprot:9616025-Lingulodinium_polyedra.AAC.1